LKNMIFKMGVGWNIELGTISATDEWWKSKSKVCFFFSTCTTAINYFIICCYNNYNAFISSLSLVVGDTRSQKV
jgi:hypothetical protein